MRLIFRKLKGNWYSIVSLISALDSRNLNVEVTFASSLEEILSYPKDSVVAYSLMTFDLPKVETEFRILKEKGYTLIAGGPHPTAKPDHVLHLGVDYVFVGDGEENILRFVMGERPSNRIFDGLKKRIDLNHYPPFDVKRNLFIPMEISRGCPFACGYCFTPVLGGRIPRYRDIDMIIHYAKLGVKKGRKIARFISSNSFGYMSRNGVRPNLDAIERLLYSLKAVGVEQIYFGTFPSDVRPESIDHDVLRIVKKYVDNRSIILGAQSGSDRILKLINRGHDVETVERAIEITRMEGFIPHVDFIFGFPFENEDDIEKTFDFIERIVRKYGAKIHAHTFMPLPGTPLANFGAGRLTKAHYRFLGSLAAKGNLDGYWHKQEELARRIEPYAVGSGSVLSETR